MKIKILILFTFILLLLGRGSSLAQENSPSPTQTINESGESIRKKVKEKVEEVINKPKAYLGTITDKSKDTLQIKNRDEKIQMISINTEQTSFAQTGNGTKEILFNDFAIGDYIIAMGLEKDSEVLEAKRVLISSPIKEPERKIIFAEVVEIIKKQITLKLNNGKNTTLNFPRTWKGPEISEIEKGMKIIVIYLPDEKDLIIRMIEIISTPEPPATPEETKS